ncbi:P-loop NTPase [Entomospira culicis]|uniref:P-loop NTPase n=1 Tax=Entomospira culicis TaxID=2719989 RepID=A0A968GJG7_9SPIO|nr:P-loop NTPase [Entomospira culicis]NIZ19850.1 P-loop NTPase [Entomospira culicis]NIZ70064.1 P-loop NTPase [Entomospira culicis]WDI37168.1 P-loop NTPase [Entomospira culicis]WDI38797.1 P-loop NTPase [Entomospira culicis]
MTIIPVASGKGGVGKSTLSTNIAITLAKKGKQVVLVDLDLGAGNLHITLGVKGISHGVGTFLVSPQMDINDLVMRTEYDKLFFLAGDGGVVGLANLTFQQKKRLINALMTIRCDYLILDLGAGSGFNTVDFFLISGRGVIVTAPNMAATLTAYLFLKNAIFRIIASAFPKDSKGAIFMDHLKRDGLSLQKIYITKLLEQLKIADPEHYPKFERTLKAFRPRLIMNMLDEPSSASKAERLRRTIVQYLGIDIEHLGVVFRDETQSRALASGLPVVIYKPRGVMTQAVNRVVDRIMLAREGNAAPFLKADDIEAGYKLAEAEASEDYMEKMGSVETFFKEGSISDGDIIETIRTQQYELNQLRKENRFLKSKIVKASKDGFKL